MNPFDITKAVDYTDLDLNKTWVDFPSKGFKEFIKPTLDMPMVIVGSKGSGKTHIMKHFSFSMQKMRYNNDLSRILKDGYIGIYLRCSGLNGYRFSGRNENEETWRDVFSYYIDLWLSQLLLQTIDDILQTNKNLVKHERNISQEILKLFGFYDITKTKSIQSLLLLIKGYQKNIDYVINNLSLTNKGLKEQIEILINPGELIFEIPKIITTYIPDFKDFKFLFLLDEFENFSDSQQMYFNTLIRERKNPVCFKIGARRYGIKTKKTLSGDEDIKAGSEFELLDLDDIFREHPKEYKEFLLKICEKRIESSNHKLKVPVEEWFNYPNSKMDFQIISNKRHHIDKFIKKLSAFKMNEKEIYEIVTNISSEDVLIERLNIFIIYRAIKKKENIRQVSEELKELGKTYKSGAEVEKYNIILDKFKQDIIDTLYRENGLRITSNCGFSNLVKISNGIPRHFLMIMKHIFRWSDFYENDVYQDLISTEIQMLAIRDTVLWFMEDAKLSSNNMSVKHGIESICNYLRELRYSDLPPECNICTFEVENLEFNNEVNEIISYLEQYSYIIKIDYGRRSKNSNKRNDVFQVNGLLSSLWELATSRRGIVKISNSTMQNLLFFNDDGEQKKIISSEVKKYNVPFNNEINQGNLFDNYGI